MEIKSKEKIGVEEIDKDAQMPDQRRIGDFNGTE